MPSAPRSSLLSRLLAVASRFAFLPRCLQPSAFRLQPFLPAVLSLQLSAFILSSPAATRQMEALDRGLIAIPTGTGQVYLSWRLLGTEGMDTGFNLYRSTNGGDPVKLNASPLLEGTNFSDTSADTTRPLSYTVRTVTGGVEGLPGRAASLAANATLQNYLSIPLQVPAAMTMPDNSTCTYSANDCSVGDLDGDGQYEIIVKWDPSNSKDNSQSGYTGNVYLDAYKLNGRHLWRIDLGKNIRAGAHYTQFMVYDLNGDGLAEIACRASDGTVDGVGKTIGDGSKDYRNSSGYILTGPEFLSIFAGPTGAEIARTDYYPTRTPDGSLTPTTDQIKTVWGDNYGNRIDRFLACVAYLDGKHPSLVMCRGYYTRAVLVAYDFTNSSLTRRWIFDSDDGTAGNLDYKGQGFHNLSVGDVDGDGFDEIVYGSCTIDHDGKGLYSTKLGHGDASHLSDIDPTRPGLEQWSCHEDSANNGNIGMSLRDAATGAVLFSAAATSDIGRGVSFDIDPRHKGYECWGALSNLYNAKGEIISSTRPSSMNFAVWWDDDLSREILDSNYIDKWNYSTSRTTRLLTATGCSSNNSTKSNPCLSADILGDWREEVIWRSTDNTELRVFSTTIPTTRRLRTLMHDPQYRLSVAWQNVAYNQPPHTRFYLGTDMETPPAPDISTSIDTSDAVIVNMSILANAGSGDSTLIAGLVAQGEQSVLVRAVGPTLPDLNVSHFLPDPILTIYKGVTALGSNNDWSAGSTEQTDSLANTADSLGAFALRRPSKDAVLMPSLANGAYTFHVTSGDGSAGPVLVEAYALSASAEKRLTNVSARTALSGSAERAITGFVISGTTPRTVLIRAIGPGLTDMGVAAAMPDPKLELYKGQTLINRNGDWGDSNADNTLFESLGAFKLSSGSKDAALLVTLSPGAYSAHAYSDSVTTPVIVMIEVYEVR